MVIIRGGSRKSRRWDLFGGLFRHMYISELGGVQIVTCTCMQVVYAAVLCMYLVSHTIHNLSIIPHILLAETYQVNWVKERSIHIKIIRPIGV